jgi:chromosome segregation ATPase
MQPLFENRRPAVPFFAKHSDEQFEELRKSCTALEAQVNDLQGKLNAEAGRAKSEAERANGEASRRAALEAQLNDLQGKLNAEAGRANSETAKAKDLQGKLNAEAGRANSETAKAKDLQEENDLLLAQLHQVQEELEKYYLKSKDLEQSVGEVTTSLRGARHLLVKSGFSSRARA